MIKAYPPSELEWRSLQYDHSNLQAEFNILRGKFDDSQREIARLKNLLREQADKGQALRCHACDQPVAYNGEHGGGRGCHQ